MTHAPRVRWHWPVHSVIAVLIAIMGYCLSPRNLLAQDVSPLETQQSVTILYGHRITFRVEATHSSALIMARLVLQVENRQTAYSVDVPVSPATHVTISQPVDVTVIPLPPTAILNATWEFTDETGLTLQSEPRTITYVDDLVPWNWVESTGERIIVYSDGREPTLASQVIALGDATIRQMGQLLDVTPQEPLRLYLYPGLAPMANALRLHNVRVEDWVVGYALPDQRTALLAIEETPDALDQLGQDVPHEITHLLIGLSAGPNSGSVPGWFSEGLAVMSSVKPNLALDNALQSAVRDDRLLDAQALCAPGFLSLPPGEATLAYAQSASMARYLIEAHGGVAVRGLMEAYSDGVPCEQGIERALGITYREFETGWQNSLRRSVARSPGNESSLLPWLIVSLTSFLLALLFIAPGARRFNRQQHLAQVRIGSSRIEQ